MKRRKAVMWIVGGILWFVYASCAYGQNELIFIENTQFARKLSAAVTDPQDYPLSGVKVEEMSPDWKQTLRATQTDKVGKFELSSVRGRTLYYLQLSYPGFNTVRVRVALDKKKRAELKV